MNRRSFFGMFLGGAAIATQVKIPPLSAMVLPHEVPVPVGVSVKSDVPSDPMDVLMLTASRLQRRRGLSYSEAMKLAAKIKEREASAYLDDYRSMYCHECKQHVR